MYIKKYLRRLLNRTTSTMMHMLRQKTVRLQSEKVVLRSKKIHDAEQDYTWKRDKQLAKLDGTYPINMTFVEYKYTYKQNLLFPDPSYTAFAIETKRGKHIGNCMCYNIDRIYKDAELGIVIGAKNYWNKKYGRSALHLLMRYCFTEIRLDRLYLHTLATNLRARSSFASAGFREVAEVLQNGKDIILMEIFKHEWEHIENVSESLH